MDRGEVDRGEVDRGEVERGHYEYCSSAGQQSYLASTDEEGEDDGAQPHSEHTVDEVATKHRENDIGPGVQGVEQSVLGHRNLHHLGSKVTQ